MRTDQSFDHWLAWFANPEIPRKRRAPAWLEVGVGAPELFPQTAKDHFKEGFITRLLILSSVLSISALIRKASAPTPRWRLSWLKLLMVTTMRQSSRFLKHHKAKMLIACERQTFLLAHRPRRSSSRNVPQRRWARRNVCCSQAKMLIHGRHLGNETFWKICQMKRRDRVLTKSCCWQCQSFQNQNKISVSCLLKILLRALLYWGAFILFCTASEDVASIQDGSRKV